MKFDVNDVETMTVSAPCAVACVFADALCCRLMAEELAPKD